MGSRSFKLEFDRASYQQNLRLWVVVCPRVLLLLPHQPFPDILKSSTFTVGLGAVSGEVSGIRRASWESEGLVVLGKHVWKTWCCGAAMN